VDDVEEMEDISWLVYVVDEEGEAFVFTVLWWRGGGGRRGRDPFFDCSRGIIDLHRCHLSVAGNAALVCEYGNVRVFLIHHLAMVIFD